MSDVYAWFWKVHVECHDIRISFTSLPFACLIVMCVVFLLSDDHQFLLMWTYVRTPSSGNDNRDVAAWWLWTGIRLSMEPVAEGMLLVGFLLSKQELVLLLIYCTYVRQCGASFLLLWICLWYGVPSYPNFRTLWIFMYVAFYYIGFIYLIGTLHISWIKFNFNIDIIDDSNISVDILNY